MCEEGLTVGLHPVAQYASILLLDGKVERRGDRSKKWRMTLTLQSPQAGQSCE